MNPVIGALVILGLFCIGVAVVDFVRHVWTPKRNRRWPSEGQSHHSYWSSARRVNE